MCRIDHQLVRLARLGCKTCEYLVEHAHTAPADKGSPERSRRAIVDRLGWPILRWRVAPAQPVLDYEKDAADDPTVINAGNAV